MNFRLFESSVYENRRIVLKENIKSGLILLMGNEESGMNYKDNWYPFRQDSCFLYYFGINLSGLAIKSINPFLIFCLKTLRLFS